MAKRPQNAAAEAAEALAAKEAEEAKAKEAAQRQEGEAAQESGQPNPQPDPPSSPPAALSLSSPPAAPPAKAEPDGEKRVFRAVHNVMLAGATHAAGAYVEITREEHAVLFSTGSVASAWDDDD